MRAAAYLTILNEELPPGELARLVGLEPDEAWAKGEPRRPGRVHAWNGVSFHSGLDEERTAPTDHLAALVDRLRPHVERIAVVAALPSTCRARIAVVEHTERDNVEAHADPERLALVARMGASVVFDVYFYDE